MVHRILAQNCGCFAAFFLKNAFNGLNFEPVKPAQSFFQAYPRSLLLWAHFCADIHEGTLDALLLKSARPSIKVYMVGFQPLHSVHLKSARCACKVQLFFDEKSTVFFAVFARFPCISRAFFVSLHLIKPA